jgi:hypothetical protein
MNEWLLSVVKKSAHTRFPRVPFTSFNKTSCSLWVRRRKKIKFCSILSFSHTTIIWYCLSSVYVPFFSRARWTTATACKLEAMFNHVLKLENVNIYITHVTSTLNCYQYKLRTFSFFRSVFSLLLLFKKQNAFSTLIWIAKKKKEEEQTKPAAIKIYVRRIE